MFLSSLLDLEINLLNLSDIDMSICPGQTLYDIEFNKNILK